MLVGLLFASTIKSAAAQPDLVPPEVISLFNDINDIDKLRVINALKLTNEQLDQIIASIKAFQVAYNKALVDTVLPPLKEIAKDIKESRTKMLKGGAVPSELDEKIKKIQDAYIKKRDTVEFNTLKGLADSCRKILTSSQIALAASLARKGTEVEGKPTAKGDDEKFFNLYVLQVILRYPRIVALLEDVKKDRTAQVSESGVKEARK